MPNPYARWVDQFTPPETPNIAQLDKDWWDEWETPSPTPTRPPGIPVPPTHPSLTQSLTPEEYINKDLKESERNLLQLIGDYTVVGLGRFTADVLKSALPGVVVGWRDEGWASKSAQFQRRLHEKTDVLASRLQTIPKESPEFKELNKRIQKHLQNNPQDNVYDALQRIASEDIGLVHHVLGGISPFLQNSFMALFGTGELIGKKLEQGGSKLLGIDYDEFPYLSAVGEDIARRWDFTKPEALDAWKENRSKGLDGLLEYAADVAMFTSLGGATAKGISRGTRALTPHSRAFSRMNKRILTPKEHTRLNIELGLPETAGLHLTRGAILHRMSKSKFAQSMDNATKTLEAVNKFINEGGTAPNWYSLPVKKLGETAGKVPGLRRVSKGIAKRIDPKTGRFQMRSGLADILDPETWVLRGAIRSGQTAISKVLSPYADLHSKRRMDLVRSYGVDPYALPASLMTDSEEVAHLEGTRLNLDDQTTRDKLFEAMRVYQAQAENIREMIGEDGDITKAGKLLEEAHRQFEKTFNEEARKWRNEKIPGSEHVAADLTAIFQVRQDMEIRRQRLHPDAPAIDEPTMTMYLDELIADMQRTEQAGLTPESIEAAKQGQPPTAPAPDTTKVSTVRTENTLGMPHRTASSSDYKHHYDVEYKIAPARRIVTSHNLDGSQNELYRQVGEHLGYSFEQLQPREHNPDMERSIASDLQPAGYLMDMRVLDRGAPIVVEVPDFTYINKDGKEVTETLYLTLAGNNRVNALRLAKQEYPTNYQRYQDDMQSEIGHYGYIPDDIKNPDDILIRVLTDKDVDIRRVADQSNTTAIRLFDAGEQSQKDRAHLNEDLLQRLDLNYSGKLGDILQNEANIDVVFEWLKKFPAAERGNMTTKEMVQKGAKRGEQITTLTELGVRRLVNALFRRTFDGTYGRKMMELFITRQDSDIRNIENGVMSALQDLAELEIGTRTSPQRYTPEYQIAEDIAQAVVAAWQFVQRGAGEGLSKSESIEKGRQQFDLLGATLENDAQELILDVIKEAIHTPSILTGFIQDYVYGVKRHATGTEDSLFGTDQNPPRQVLLDQLHHEYFSEDAEGSTTSEVNESQVRYKQPAPDKAIATNRASMSKAEFMHALRTGRISKLKTLEEGEAFHTTESWNWEQIMGDEAISSAETLAGKQGTQEAREFTDHAKAIDEAAGDTRYVFLSYGENNLYSTGYAFLFDAELLVTEHNAIVGNDLIDNYTAQLHEVAHEIGKELGIDESEIDDYVTDVLFDDIPIGIIRDFQSAADENVGYEFAERLQDRFYRATEEIRHQQRDTGEKAKSRLATGVGALEILVPDQIPLDSPALIGVKIDGETRMLTEESRGKSPSQWNFIREDLPEKPELAEPPPSPLKLWYISQEQQNTNRLQELHDTQRLQEANDIINEVEQLNLFKFEDETLAEKPPLSGLAKAADTVKGTIKKLVDPLINNKRLISIEWEGFIPNDRIETAQAELQDLENINIGRDPSLRANRQLIEDEEGNRLPEYENLEEITKDDIFDALEQVADTSEKAQEYQSQFLDGTLPENIHQKAEDYAYELAREATNTGVAPPPFTAVEIQISKLPLKDMESRLTQLFSILNKNGAKVNDTAGFHVHIDKRGMTHGELSNLLFSWFKYEWAITQQPGWQNAYSATLSDSTLFEDQEILAAKEWLQEHDGNLVAAIDALNTPEGESAKTRIGSNPEFKLRDAAEWDALTVDQEKDYLKSLQRSMKHGHNVILSKSDRLNRFNARGTPPGDQTIEFRHGDATLDTEQALRNVAFALNFVETYRKKALQPSVRPPMNEVIRQLQPDYTETDAEYYNRLYSDQTVNDEKIADKAIEWDEDPNTYYIPSEYWSLFKQYPRRTLREVMSILPTDVDHIAVRRGTINEYGNFSEATTDTQVADIPLPTRFDIGDIEIFGEGFDAPDIPHRIRQRFIQVQDGVSLNLVGMDIRDPRELAIVAQALRGNHESTRFFWVDSKTNEIVGYSVTSLGKTAESNTLKTSVIRAKLESAEADSFFFLHNHPAGSPQFSAGDRARAKDYKDAFGDKFIGSVVINSGQFAYEWLTQKAQVEEPQLNNWDNDNNVAYVAHTGGYLWWQGDKLDISKLNAEQQILIRELASALGVETASEVYQAALKAPDTDFSILIEDFIQERIENDSRHWGFYNNLKGTDIIWWFRGIQKQQHPSVYYYDNFSEAKKALAALSITNQDFRIGVVEYPSATTPEGEVLEEGIATEKYDKAERVPLTEEELGWNPDEIETTQSGVTFGKYQLKARDPRFMGAETDEADIYGEGVYNLRDVVGLAKRLQVPDNWINIAFINAGRRMTDLLEIDGNDLRKYSKSQIANWMRKQAVIAGATHAFVMIGKGDWYKDRKSAIHTFIDDNDNNKTIAPDLIRSVASIEGDVLADNRERLDSSPAPAHKESRLIEEHIQTKLHQPTTTSTEQPTGVLREAEDADYNLKGRAGTERQEEGRAQPGKRQRDVDLANVKQPVTYGQLEAWRTYFRREKEKHEYNSPQYNAAAKLEAAMHESMERTMMGYNPQLWNELQAFYNFYKDGAVTMKAKVAKAIRRHAEVSDVEGTSNYTRMVESLFSPDDTPENVELLYTLIGGRDSEAGKHVRAVFLESLLEKSQPRGALLEGELMKERTEKQRDAIDQAEAELKAAPDDTARTRATAKLEEAKQELDRVRRESQTMQPIDTINPTGLSGQLETWLRRKGKAYKRKTLDAILGKEVVNALIDLRDFEESIRNLKNAGRGSRTGPWISRLLANDAKRGILRNSLNTLSAIVHPLGLAMMGGATSFAYFMSGGSRGIAVGVGVSALIFRWLGIRGLQAFMHYTQNKGYSQRYLLEGTVFALDHVLSGTPILASPEQATRHTELVSAANYAGPKHIWELARPIRAVQTQEEDEGYSGNGK